MSILSVKDLTVNYGAIRALKGICLDVEPGEIITLIEWTDYWPENARVPRIKP